MWWIPKQNMNFIYYTWHYIDLKILYDMAGAPTALQLFPKASQHLGLHSSQQAAA